MGWVLLARLKVPVERKHSTQSSPEGREKVQYSTQHSLGFLSQSNPRKIYSHIMHRHRQLTAHLCFRTKRVLFVPRDPRNTMQQQ